MIQPTKQGKVRDIYDLGDELMLVTSDRVSAFDYILPSSIPHKGTTLNLISKFWFDYMEDNFGIKNHMISTDVKDLPEQFKADSEYLNGRFMLVEKLDMLPVECIVRGYLTGSGYKEYKSNGTVCGLRLKEGLVDGSKIDPIFTPSTKAEIGDHDENISFEQLCELVGVEDAKKLEELSKKIYQAAQSYALENGVIIADTKIEFGKNKNGEIVIGDELLTPDSSRFWDASQYDQDDPGPQSSLDKQYVRNWLQANWDKNGEPPELPKEVVEKTSLIYTTTYEKITGKQFPFDK